MGRNLSKGDFGLINTIFSLSFVVGIFLGAHKYWIIQDYVEKKDNLLASLRSLYHHMAIVSIIIFFFSIMIFLLREQIYSWFKFHSSMILLIFVLNNLIGVWNTPIIAYFQSKENFLLYGLSSFISNASKVFFIGIFIFQGLNVENTYLSFTLASLMGFLFLIFWLVKKVSFSNMIKAFSIKTSSNLRYHQQAGEFLRYFSSAFVASTIFNFDIILIRYLLSPEVSGDYAGASLMGKGVFVFSGVIIEVFYPMAVKVKTETKASLNILNRGLAISFIIGFSGFIAIYFLCPSINTYFFLDKFDNHLIRIYSLFICVMVINMVYIHFFIALKSFLFVFILFAFPIAQFLIIRYTADTAIEVINVNMSVAFSMLLIFAIIHVSKVFNNRKVG